MESFNNINMWYKLIKDIVKSDEKPYKYILIGNKCDLNSRRIVTIDQASQFAQDNNMQYFETSYYYKDDINNIFENISSLLLSIKKDIQSSDEKALNLVKIYGKQESSRSIKRWFCY